MGYSLAYMVADRSSSEMTVLGTQSGIEMHPMTAGTGIGLESRESPLG